MYNRRIMMITMSKRVVSVFFLFVFCWSGPIVEARNKLISNEALARMFAPEPSPRNETNFPFGEPSGCKDMVEKYNYPCEEHKVVTKDGHILGMQRITGGHNSSGVSNSSEGKPPVLLQHGILIDGIGWMLVERDSLAFVLADNGFDVWVNNNRGTKYSKGHKWLNVFDERYWDWSWQELSEIDLDACVDYVYKKTGQKVHYAGHSMGTLVALAALASRQPTIEKMRSIALLSPIGYLNLCTSVFGQLAAQLFLGELRDMFMMHEFNPVGRFAAEFCAEMCRLSMIINCSPSLWLMTGPNCCIDKESFNRYLDHEPQSTSTKTLMHLSQNIRGGGIAKYDYGLRENLNRYGQKSPPQYNMKNIPKDFPLYLAYGGLDALADLLDVFRLINDLEIHNQSKLVKNFQLFYAHMDYQLAHAARKTVYEPMVSFFHSN